MIVLDSSILVAVVRGEPDVGRLLNLLDAEECAVGAPTLVEARLWCAINLKAKSSDWLEDFIGERPATVVAFGHDMADAASKAFRAFGSNSGHAARLNYGDCMAYAVSAVLRAPLLFKGGDFGLTDVLAHPASIRR
jgi:ribonuclease VapC